LCFYTIDRESDDWRNRRSNLVLVVPGDSGDAPELRNLFPSIFGRSFPVVEPSAFMLTASSVLRFHGIEAALVLADHYKPMRNGKKVLFIGGKAVLERVRIASPEESYNLLFEPCVKIAMGLEPIEAGQSLGDLLKLFAESRFGFTVMVEGNLFSLVGLTDLVQLYEEGRIGTDLKAGDVASPRVSVGKGTSLRDAIRVLFERNIRRVFIDGRRKFVSDREIISYIFSPMKLEEARASPKALLDGPLIDAGIRDADEVTDDTSLKDCASAISRSQGSVIVCEKGVVSPWDLVMKPFLMKRLSVNRNSG
jgi:CBS domain-containing protein